MREIIFRGKCGEEWVYGDLQQPFCDGNKLEKKAYIVTHSYAGKGMFGIATSFCVCVESSTVGQFTGLMDRKGTRIFEGDIVGGESFEGNDFVVHQSREGYVIQQNGEWLFDFADSLEVIGNIHDNPELLESQK